MSEGEDFQACSLTTEPGSEGATTSVLWMRAMISRYRESRGGACIHKMVVNTSSSTKTGRTTPWGEDPSNELDDAEKSSRDVPDIGIAARNSALEVATLAAVAASGLEHQRYRLPF